MSTNWDPPAFGFWASVIWALGLCATAAGIFLWAIGLRAIGRFLASLAVVASLAPGPIIVFYYAPQAPEEKPFLAGGLAGLCLIQWLIWMLFRALGERNFSNSPRVNTPQNPRNPHFEGFEGASNLEMGERGVARVPALEPVFPPLPEAHEPLQGGQALPPLLPLALAWEPSELVIRIPSSEPLMLQPTLRATEESSGMLALEAGTEFEFPEPQFPELAWPAEMGQEPNPREVTI